MALPKMDVFFTLAFRAEKSWEVLLF